MFGFTFIRFFVHIIFTVIKQFIPLGQRLRRYCKEDGSTWAVVTGATDGIGLKNMERKVEQLSATFTIHTKIGRGTTIIIHLPL